MSEIENRVVGTLFGLAAGDQIGGPIRMALEVAESLRDQRAFDLKNIGARYIEWWRRGGFDSGPTAAHVFELASAGMPLHDAAVQVNDTQAGLTAGCNPAHRSMPLAMLQAIEDSALIPAANADASLTHQNPLAGDAAAGVSVLCRALIRGMPWKEALDLAASGRLSEIRRAIEDRRSDMLSQGGFAPDVLRAAVFFVHSSSTFSDALKRSLSFAGVPNYSPVLVGSIGGARWGKSAIDQSDLIIRHQDLLPRLRAVATDLARDWTNADDVRL